MITLPPIENPPRGGYEFRGRWHWPGTYVSER